MLPNTTTSVPSSSIHINPRFRNVHINPNFLSKSNGMGHSAEPTVATAPTQIYINPRFLGNVNTMAMTQVTNSSSQSVHATENQSPAPLNDTMSPVDVPMADTKIHTRTKIFNTQLKPINDLAANQMDRTKRLIKIGSKKLVRIPTKPAPSSPFSKPTNAILTVRRPLQTKYKIVKEQSTFKIDRRSTKAKRAAVIRHMLPLGSINRKFGINETLTPTKMIKNYSTLKLVKIASPTISSAAAVLQSSHQKTPTFLNINGILYKSNRRKLEKTNISSSFSIQKSKTSGIAKPKQSYRRLIVRGENFLLDASGKNLIREKANTTRALSTTNAKVSTMPAAFKRIDIGKITFVKNSNDTFVRTDYHKSRYHLNVAKQRSIQTLTNRLVKTNLPCPIYRKLGKCAAFVRGKCTKLHDKKLVDVCPRFLKGICDKSPCLLSHDMTLAKMPTCKFFLLGMCFKTDCPYLHKKVNKNTEICVDFLRGFCEKAEQCTKRHEFLCPEQQTKGSCNLTRCPYPHRSGFAEIEQSHIEKPERVKVKREKIAKSSKIARTLNKPSTIVISANVTNDTDAKLSVKRYFDDDDDGKKQTSDTNTKCTESELQTPSSSSSAANESVERIIVERKPTIGSLPSFIPIG